MRPHLNQFSRPPRPPAVGDIAQQLRELPSEAAPPYDFAEFRRRSLERSAPGRQWVTWPYAAAAAGLTTLVAVMALLGTSGPPANDDVGPAASAPATAVADSQRGDPSSRPDGTDAADSSAAARGARPADDNSASPRGVGLASNNAGTPRAEASAASEESAAAEDAFERARAAREWLARQPMEPALVRAGPRLTVAGIEDRIAWFDDALTDQRLHGASPDQLKVLQQERARLVSSLAQVRYAEALVAGGS